MHENLCLAVISSFSFYLPFLVNFKNLQNFPFLGWNIAGLVFAR